MPGVPGQGSFIGEIFAIVSADTTPLNRNLGLAESRLGTFSRRGVRGTKKLTNGFDTAAFAAKGLAAVIAFRLTRATIRFAKESLVAAANAEETANKFQVVFEGVGIQAQATADNISSSFRLANSSTQDYLGSVGDILTGLGFVRQEALNLSTALVRLAGDLTSLKNVPMERSMRALTSAIVGQTRPAKALGIVIRQDTEEFKKLVKQTMDAKGITIQQAKAFVILQQAIAQSTNSIGDYERTIHSTTNIARALWERTKQSTEVFGQFLLSVLPVNSVMEILNTTLQGTESIFRVLSKHSPFGDMGAAIGMVNTEVNDTNKKIEELRARTKAAGEEQVRAQKEISAATKKAEKERLATADRILASQRRNDSLERSNRRAMFDSFLQEKSLNRELLDAKMDFNALDGEAREAARGRMLNLQNELALLKKSNSERVKGAVKDIATGVFEATLRTLNADAQINQLIEKRVSLQKEISNLEKTEKAKRLDKLVEIAGVEQRIADIRMQSAQDGLSLPGQVVSGRRGGTAAGLRATSDTGGAKQAEIARAAKRSAKALEEMKGSLEDVVRQLEGITAGDL